MCELKRVDSIVNKNPAFVDQLYRDHQSWLHQWLRKKIGSSEHAADLVQDTFIKILQTRDELFGIKEPRAYLVTIARNLMIDQVRRKRIEQAYLDELGQMEYLLDAIPSPEDQLQIIQAIDQICQALASVSEKAQRAFVLHYFEGLTHKEIAEQIGVSTKMIQKYLARCLVQCYVLKQEKDLFI